MANAVASIMGLVIATVFVMALQLKMHVAFVMVMECLVFQ